MMFEIAYIPDAQTKSEVTRKQVRLEKSRGNNW